MGNSYMLGTYLIPGMAPSGRVPELLQRGCPTCDRIYDRVAEVQADQSIKMVCAGCSTAYYTDAPIVV